MTELKRLQNQLNQLEKTYKAGIIGKEEFDSGKANIEKKLKPLLAQEKKKQESNKIVEEIISKKEPKEKAPEPKKKLEEKKPEPKKEIKEQEHKESKKETPKKEEPKKEEKKAVPVKPSKKEKKPKVKTEKKAKKIPDKEENLYSKLSIWAGLFFILLVIILFLFIRGPDQNTSVIEAKDLSGINKTITLEVFSSYSCEYCMNMATTIGDIQTLYGDHVKIVKKHYPYNLEVDLDIDMAVECVRELNPDKIEGFEKLIYKSSKPISTERLVLLAETAGLEGEEMQECIADNRTLQKVVADYKSALSRKIDRIPAVIIGYEMASGLKPLAFYEIMIDDKLSE